MSPNTPSIHKHTQYSHCYCGVSLSLLGTQPVTNAVPVPVPITVLTTSTIPVPIPVCSPCPRPSLSWCPSLPHHHHHGHNTSPPQSPTCAHSATVTSLTLWVRIVAPWKWGRLSFSLRTWTMIRNSTCQGQRRGTQGVTRVGLGSPELHRVPTVCGHTGEEPSSAQVRATISTGDSSSCRGQGTGHWDMG